MTIILPTKALSIRQPWAWAVVHGGKDVENRDWNRSRLENIKFRGEFCIHAATGMTQHEYFSACDFMQSIKVTAPASRNLKRGMIIGTANLVDIVTESDSPWFFGSKGLILEDIKPLDEPIPCVGSLGFFNWKRAGDDYPKKPTKWMNAEPRPEAQKSLLPETENDLFGAPNE